MPDTKPFFYLNKSEVVKRAETAEARAEAKKQAEAEADTLRIVFSVEGEYPDGTKWSRDATQEEKSLFEQLSE